MHNINEFRQLIKPQMRLMGLDVGAKKVGIALSDLSQTIASPLSVALRQGANKELKFYQDFIQEQKVSGIVVGWPLEARGTVGESCQIVQQFIDKTLSKLALPILLADERLSTALSQRLLKKGDYSRFERDKLDDKIAASIILQEVLDKLRYGV